MVPEAEEQAGWRGVSECTRGKLAVRPNTGDAVLFWNLSPDGKEDSGATHGSCDVITGVKFSAPIWMRQAPFHPRDLAPEGPRVCVDETSSCVTWAEHGECVRNPGFMSAQCALSCHQCA